MSIVVVLAGVGDMTAVQLVQNFSFRAFFNDKYRVVGHSAFLGGRPAARLVRYGRSRLTEFIRPGRGGGGRPSSLSSSLKIYLLYKNNIW